MSETDIYRRLCREIKRYDRVAVAFSGGIDSTLLLKIAIDCLGKLNVLAIMANSPLVAKHELQEATKVASSLGVNLRTIQINQLQIEKIARNHRDRCFFCKEKMFHSIVELAIREECKVILEGSNISDKKDYRPGMEAIRRFNMVKNPYLDFGVTKTEIRKLAFSLGLENWDKPSEACLASRIPYGTRLTLDNLGKVASTESRIRQLLGIKKVRVRYHGDLARIEIAPEEFQAFLNLKTFSHLSEIIKSGGFTYATLDLDGYKTGKMNN